MRSDAVRIVVHGCAELLELHAPPGENLMQLAVAHNVPGIDAECGGSCTCGTCHVYLGTEFASMVAPAGPDEQALLTAVAADRRPTSRLACQVVVPPARQLELEIPPRQS